MINNPKDSTTTVKVVCAILFIIFTISYIYSFQGDVLGMTQYAWSGGKTHYDRTVGVTVLVIIFSLISLFVGFITSLPQRLYSLVYFPAMLSMGLLTAVELSGKSVATSTTWLISAPVLLMLFFVGVNAAKKFQPFLVPLRSTTFLSQPWWTNVTLLAVMGLLTYSMGNTDRTLHTRLAIERHCKEKQWDMALEQGFPQYDNDSSLTMLRAMALAHTNELGERLFEYQITGSSRSLFPQQDNSVCFLLSPGYQLWQTIGFVPRNLSEPVELILRRELRRGTAKPVSKDYLLCAYLLDRDLKSFAYWLQRYYEIDKTLPKHYGEAYVLYCRKYNKECLLKDSALAADYSDFLTLLRSNRNPVLRNAALRDAYFGTYWYYYQSK